MLEKFGGEKFGGVKIWWNFLKSWGKNLVDFFFQKHGKKMLPPLQLMPWDRFLKIKQDVLMKILALNMFVNRNVAQNGGR